MIINHNISAMNTYRQLTMNTEFGAKSLEKLSSGLRINRAGDDAAGLAISEKMRGQIRGLNMAAKNAQDGISLIQTAEGALNETHDILQRMRELAVQSASDTNTEVDRGEIQKEIDELAKELTRIANTTEFNTQNLLGGEFNAKFHIGANEGQNVDLKIEAMDSESLKVHGDIYKTEVDLTGFMEGVEVYSRTGEKVTIIVADLQSTGGDEIAKTTAEVTGDGDSGWTITVTLAQAEDGGAITATNRDVLKALQSVGAEAGIFFQTNEDFDASETAASGIALDVAAATESNGNWVKEEDATVGINVSTQKMADSAITAINDAIETVSAERSKLGAMQNRLEHTINNLSTAAENLQAAEARIRDVDMANEIMEFTKNSILQQASTAMLAQANMVPQGVLQLLR